MIGGVYETQTQLFSKKIRVGEIRIYAEPFAANNSFTFALIGSNNGVIAGSSQTFTPTVGDDFVRYSPAIAPTFALGTRITNTGTANFTITKIEVDWTPAGN